MSKELFFYWMNERQRIYLKKEAGQPFPWTEDEILQTYKFTNVFREQDAVTVALRNRVSSNMPHWMQFWRIYAFRMFNWPGTYDDLLASGVLLNWNARSAQKVLRERQKRGDQIFTGAYIITNAGSTRPKIEIITEAMTPVWKKSKDLVAEMKSLNTLQDSMELLCDYPTIGHFIAYEIVTDLRHTPILNNADDIYGWANPGPGARRGLNRIFRGNKNNKVKTHQYIDEMQFLQEEAPKYLDKTVFKGHVIEMRDIEHSLCEFDKYMRVKLGEGRPRSVYHAR